MATLPLRRLGATDFRLTTLGLGTWAIGGGDWKFGWGPQDEREAIGAILRGHELGIHWIDTAPVYGNGRSEELVGKALADIPPDTRPLLATKCGRIVQPDGSVEGNLSPDSIRAECDASLRRLHVETIDLYQIHWPQPDAAIEEAWQTLIDLQQAGKVRQIAVSNHSVAQMKRLAEMHPIASLQSQYSMLARDIEHDLLPYCAQQNIGVVVYSPLCKGLLTGAFTTARAAALSSSDHRSRDPRFQQPQLSIHLELVDALRDIADSYQRPDGQPRSLGELAIAWTLRRPEVTSAIVGARRPAQIEELVAGAAWQLAEADLQQIAGLLERHTRALDAAT